MEFVRGEGGLDDIEEDELLPRAAFVLLFVLEKVLFDWCTIIQVRDLCLLVLACASKVLVLVRPDPRYTQTAHHPLPYPALCFGLLRKSTLSTLTHTWKRSRRKRQLPDHRPFLLLSFMFHACRSLSLHHHIRSRTCSFPFRLLTTESLTFTSQHGALHCIVFSLRAM